MLVPSESNPINTAMISDHNSGPASEAGSPETPSAERPQPSGTARRAAELPSMRMLLLLIGVIIVTGLTVLVVVGIYFSRAQDRQAAQASRTLAQAALQVESRDVASILDSYAWWDEAVAEVQGPANPKRLDDNFGSYQTRSHGIVASFVLDPANRTTIGYIDGKPTTADALKSLSGGLGLLVKQARESNLIEPVTAAGFLMLDGRPMLVGVDAITPELGSPAWPAAKPRFVLVFARPIDDAFLARISRHTGLVGLRIANHADRDLVDLPLTSPDGTEIGRLEWVPESPAWDVIMSAAPLGGITLSFMAIMFAALLHRVRRVGDALRRQAALIDEVRDTILSTDASGAITHWSAGAVQMLGYQGREIIGKPFSILLPEADRASVMEKLEALRGSQQHFELEVSLRKQDGRVFPTHLSLTQLHDRMGRFAGMVGYGLDITVQKDLERRLEELATVDELTGACNRRYLQIHGPIELQRARRFRRPLAAMMIDLDHFKRVNDRFGHQFGDLVLSMLCELCRKALRPSDIFVRYGGEEFVVLMPETELSEALTAARRLANRIRTTVFSADPAIQGLTVSIGVCALEPADGDIGALVNRADGAMYRAKQLGRDRVESCPEGAA